MGGNSRAAPGNSTQTASVGWSGLLLMLGVVALYPDSDRTRGRWKLEDGSSAAEWRWWDVDAVHLREEAGRFRASHFLHFDPHFTWRDLPQELGMARAGIGLLILPLRGDAIGSGDLAESLDPGLGARDREIGRALWESLTVGVEGDPVLPLFAAGSIALRMGTAWVGWAMTDLIFVPQLGVSLPLEAPSSSFPGKLHPAWPEDEESWEPFIPPMVRGVVLPIVIPEPSIVWLGVFGWVVLRRSRVGGRRGGGGAGPEGAGLRG